MIFIPKLCPALLQAVYRKQLLKNGGIRVAGNNKCIDVNNSLFSILYHSLRKKHPEEYKFCCINGWYKGDQILLPLPMQNYPSLLSPHPHQWGPHWHRMGTKLHLAHPGCSFYSRESRVHTMIILNNTTIKVFVTITSCSHTPSCLKTWITQLLEGCTNQNWLGTAWK